MAVWRLTQKHYINVPGTEWEYKETDQNTGRQGRKVFEVPLYLDPEDPGDQTPRGSGEILVTSSPNPAFRHALVFQGDPTPDMEPVDPEAQAISDRIRASGAWVHPIDSLSGNFSASVLAGFEKEIVELVRRGADASKPAAGPDLTALQTQMAEMSAKMEALSARNAQLESTRRRL